MHVITCVQPHLQNSADSSVGLTSLTERSTIVSGFEILKKFFVGTRLLLAMNC